MRGNNYGVSKVLLIFGAYSGRDNNVEDPALIQYLDCSLAVEEINQRLAKCVLEEVELLEMSRVTPWSLGLLVKKKKNVMN